MVTDRQWNLGGGKSFEPRDPFEPNGLQDRCSPYKLRNGRHRELIDGYFNPNANPTTFGPWENSRTGFL
jgi:hypothetical protein